jgi:hypothetical protein
MRSVLVGVGESSPVFGMIRLGSINLGCVARETIKGRLKASPQAAMITIITMYPLLFLSKPMLLSLYNNNCISVDGSHPF